jgi:Mg-chelatase subunit ChlD
VQAGVTLFRSAVRSALVLALACAPSVAWPQESSSQPPAQAPKTTFKSSVDVVSVAAVVRDKRGRFAANLKKEDFVVKEAGARREIVDFHADTDAPVRVALLFDISGSMRLLDRLEEARQAARHVLGALRFGGAEDAPSTRAGASRVSSRDEAAVFSFDMNLQSLQPFTADAGAIESALARVTPYGQTSLYDAIAQTAQRVADTRPGDPHRRAVVVFTDGVDTSSLLTPEQVSAIASEIDVPVYVMTVVSPADYEDRGVRNAVPNSVLRTLAQWTGGDLFVTSAPAHESIAARQIVDELRHQYVLAFPASPAAGWHPLDVQTKDRDLTVRARRGYAAGTRAGSKTL